MSNYLNKYEWIEKAKISAAEFQLNKYIDDLVVLEFDEEYFFFIFKTKYDRDFLYDKIKLTDTTSLYDVLFEHNLMTDGDLYEHVIKNILPEKSKEIEYLNGAYCHLPLENKCIIKEESTISGVKKIVISIPSIEV